MNTEPVTPEENVPAEVPVEGEAPAESTAATTPTPPVPEVTENDRMMAAVAYATQVLVPILVPAIMLLSEENKKRPFQKYHAIQSLGFLAAAVIYEVLATIVFIGLSIVSMGCLSCILWVLFLLPLIPAFYYAYQAYQGLYFEIPLVTEFLIQNKWLEKPAA